MTTSTLVSALPTGPRTRSLRAPGTGIARPVGPVLAAASALGLALAVVAGCKSPTGGSPLAHADPSDDAFADVPIPAADGPKLVALRGATPVFDRPSTKATRLGELRVGSVVVRSKETYGTRGCDGGWYAVRPRGFVCGEGAAIDAATAGKLPAAPDLSRALPYRYGRTRTENVPLYAHTPTTAEQGEAEPDLARLMKHGVDADPIGAAADDVPLDVRGVATGPAVLLPASEGMIDGKRTATSWFAFAGDAAVAPSIPAAAKLEAAALRKGSGIALAGAFTTADARRFGVTVDGHVVPTDRLRPLLGSTWHGIDLDKVGLPMAFVHKLGVHAYALQKGKAVKRDDELERRSAVPLTGRFRTVDGLRFEETRGGDWLRAQDLVVIVKRHKYPDFVKGNQKWLDVSIANQTLTAYEGTKPIYATLISSGRDMLKDAEGAASTPRGTFKIVGKYVTRPRDAREAQNAFDLPDAPWVLEFDGGAALTGSTWIDGMGEAQSFHDVALTPIDARRIWTWSDPPMPDGWHGVTAGGDDATVVNIRP